MIIQESILENSSKELLNIRTLNNIAKNLRHTIKKKHSFCNLIMTICGNKAAIPAKRY